MGAVASLGLCWVILWCWEWGLGVHALGIWEKLHLFLSWAICVWSREGKLPELSPWGILSVSEQSSAVQFELSGHRGCRVLWAAGTNPSPVAVPSVPAPELLLGPAAAEGARRSRAAPCQ